MNNTAYVPPGSLSVFSNNVTNASTVTPLQEAIMSRMRPFGLTVLYFTNRMIISSLLTSSV